MSTFPATRRFALAVAHLLVSFVLLANVSNARAQDRVYNIVDYPVNEIDYYTGSQDTVSGTIITDGALGTLNRSDIIGGTLTMSGNNQSFQSDGSWFSGQSPIAGITATPSLLTFSTGEDFDLQAGSGAATLTLTYYGYGVGDAQYQGFVYDGLGNVPIMFTVTDPSPASSQSITHNYPFVIADGGQLIPEPTNGQWATNGSGTWSGTANWSNGYVPGAQTQDIAVFGTILTGGTATVTLDSSRSLSSLGLSTTGTNSYAISPVNGSTLTLANTATGIATISNSGGNNTIGVPIILGSNLSVTASTGSALAIAGGVSESNSGTSLSLGGGGELILSGTDTYTGGTVVNGGTLAVTAASALPISGVLVVGRSGCVVLGNSLGAAELLAASSLTSESSSLAATPAVSSIDRSAAGQESNTSASAMQADTPTGAPLSGSPTAVPEPGALALLGVFAVGMLACARRRRKI